MFVHKSEEKKSNRANVVVCVNHENAETVGLEKTLRKKGLQSNAYIKNIKDLQYHKNAEFGPSKL